MICSEGVQRELQTYCYLVRNGKPAAMMPIQERYAEEAKTTIQSYGLNHYFEQLSDGWLTLWVYKLPFIMEVIKSAPQVPNTIFDHWVLGKLFGYSEEAIQEFIQSKLGV